MQTKGQECEEQVEECMECHSRDTSSLVNLFGMPGNYMCKTCIDLASEELVQLKNGNVNDDYSYDRINEWIYLGNEDAANCREILEKLGVTSILVCGSFLMTTFSKEEQYEYLQFDIADQPSEKIEPLFDASYKWIEKQIQQKRKVLIHCAAGVSRSASFTIAYLMKKQNLTYEEAFLLVKGKRCLIYPNSGFRKQLKSYEKALKAKLKD